MEDKEAACRRRVKLAEEDLRNALEDLQRHHYHVSGEEGGGGGGGGDDGSSSGGGGGGDDGSSSGGGRGNDGSDGASVSVCTHQDSCVANAIGNLCQSFLLAYGVRVGIGILLRAFKLAKGQSLRSILDIKLLVSEKDLIVREEACRIGLLFGGFTGSYHAIRCSLRKIRGKETPLNPFLAGSIAGLSILTLDDSSKRRTLALYLLTRLAQCAYNSAKSNNKFHLWGSHWRHGDTLLFSLASAQVTYAFIMRPETLPKSYLDFLTKTSPVAEPALKAVRESCRGGPIDIVTLSAYLSRRGFKTSKFDPSAPIIPCAVIHPDSGSCVVHNANATYSTFRKTFPFYFSLTFVPNVILNLQKFMDSPIATSWSAFRGSIRSTSFLSAFVGIFQGVICLHRKMVTRDHKLVYWFAGAIAALSLLLEKKSRRHELALYVLPRAADSLWYILVNRHLLPDVKNAEVALFSLCMGGIMYYLDYEPETMAPFLQRLIRRFLASKITASDPTLNVGPYSYNNGYLSPSENKRDKPPASDSKKRDLNLAFSGL